jgi:hypothetical protein
LPCFFGDGKVIVPIIVMRVAAVDVGGSFFRGKIDNGWESARWWHNAQNVQRPQYSRKVAKGKNGTIHTYGDGSTWIIYVASRSDKHWT